MLLISIDYNNQRDNGFDCLIVSFGLFASCQCLRMAEEEVDKMAAIAEQEKFKNIKMEKQLQAMDLPSANPPVPGPVHDLKLALQEKDK